MPKVAVVPKLDTNQNTKKSYHYNNLFVFSPAPKALRSRSIIQVLRVMRDWGFQTCFPHFQGRVATRSPRGFRSEKPP